MQLEAVVLHDVAQGAGLVVELAAALDADRLGHGDLDRVDVAPVPDRLEQPVPEAEDRQVLNRLLAEVVVDPIDLVLGEHLGDLAVQRSRGLEVVAERLLDDHARPAPLGADGAIALARREPGVVEMAHDLRVEARRNGQVEEAVAGGAAVPVDAIEALRELGVGGRVVEVAALVLDRGGDRLPDLRLDRAVATVLVDPVQQVVAELVVGPFASREAHAGELRRQEPVEEAVVEGGRELALGEVARRAADDHRARLGDPLVPQALAQRVGLRRRRGRLARRNDLCPCGLGGARGHRSTRDP